MTSNFDGLFGMSVKKFAYFIVRAITEFTTFLYNDTVVARIFVQIDVSTKDRARQYPKRILVHVFENIILCYNI